MTGTISGVEYFYPEQTGAFLYSIVVGVFVGLLWDLLTVKRNIVKTGAVVRFAEDFLLCIFTFAAFLFFVLKANYGMMRWYEIGGAYIGFATYRFAFGRFVVKILTTVAGWAVYVVSLMLKTLVIKPVMLAVRIGGKMVKAIHCHGIEKAKRRKSKALAKRLERSAAFGFEKG